MLTPLHYAVLVALYNERLETGHGLNVEQIRARLLPAWRVELRPHTALARVVSQLCDPDYHDDGPLVRYDRQRYHLTGREDIEGDEQSGGYMVLYRARQNHRLPLREKQWIAMVRNPTTAAQSAIQPVAVPTGSTVHGQPFDAERAIFRTRTRARFAVVARVGFKRCPGCAQRGRTPMRPIQEFGKRSRGGRRSHCKQCRREMAREKRQG